jgi:peptide/nickel transport system substrate-binding protein
MRMSRRNFLKISTLATTGTILAACGANPTQPAPTEAAVVATTAVEPTKPVVVATVAPASMTFSEAPMLAELVKSGKLPKVEDRLPAKEDLVVVTPFEEVGQYGGTMRLISGSDSGFLKMFMAYEMPVRVNPDYTAYEPDLYKSVELSDDGMTLTMNMRKGMKWSDGEPYTTEDIRFWWEDLCLSEDYQEIRPPWWGYKNDKAMEVEIVDDYTWKIHIAEPDFAIIKNVLAVGFWEWQNLMKPKHYLMQFHPKYTPDAKFETFTEKDNYMDNPDYPTIFAWHTIEFKAGEKWTLERNPYYWKVDTNGQQLPYVDNIENKIAEDSEVRLLQIASGQVDCDWRNAYNPKNVSLLKDKAQAGEYRVMIYSDALLGYPALGVNQNHTQDPYIRELLRTPDFLRALSVAVDRNRINDVVWNGLAITCQGATVSNPAYQFTDDEGRKILDDWMKLYVDYDPDLAKQMLDGLGLNTLDADGFRTRKDGTKLELIIDINGWGGGPDNNAALAQSVKPMWEAVGLRVLLVTTYGTPDESLRWEEGKTQIRTYAMGTYNLWNWPDETFPINSDSTWPLVGKWYATGGKEGEAPAPGSVEERLLALHAQGVKESDPVKQAGFLHQAAKIHMEEGPFDIGFAGMVPIPVVVKNNLRNVRDYGILGPWEVGTPGNLLPEQFFFKVS